MKFLLMTILLTSCSSYTVSVIDKDNFMLVEKSKTSFITDDAVYRCNISENKTTCIYVDIRRREEFFD